ncbi:MAG: hypothetical protein KatS3mg105_1606 [Gemmatales bacterium]|nr:MAG: hypothetical protein KatS3mg105_1606 [Gemmatales bacterium]
MTSPQSSLIGQNLVSQIEAVLRRTDEQTANMESACRHFDALAIADFAAWQKRLDEVATLVKGVGAFSEKDRATLAEIDAFLKRSAETLSSRLARIRTCQQKLASLQSQAIDTK